jgi:hypothetical protein
MNQAACDRVEARRAASPALPRSSARACDDADEDASPTGPVRVDDGAVSVEAAAHSIITAGHAKTRQWTRLSQGGA